MSRLRQRILILSDTSCLSFALFEAKDIYPQLQMSSNYLGRYPRVYKGECSFHPPKDKGTIDRHIFMPTSPPMSTPSAEDRIPVGGEVRLIEASHELVHLHQLLHTLNEAAGAYDVDDGVVGRMQRVRTALELVEIETNGLAEASVPPEEEEGRLAPPPLLGAFFATRRIPAEILGPAEDPEVASMLHPARKVTALEAAYHQAMGHWSRLLRIQRVQQSLLLASIHILSPAGQDDYGERRVEEQLLQSVRDALQGIILNMAMVAAREHAHAATMTNSPHSSPYHCPDLDPDRGV
jgi:hypothetical protein